jgi:CheY-like chemotaxis protein/HPt (histidine-containing phosphotransfer) domain-containing protein
MSRRITELRDLREGAARRDPATCDEARAIGQALRGSGATFGFPELTAVASLVETAPDAELPRRLEGLIEHLHGLMDGSDPQRAVRAEWLARAAGVSTEDGAPFEDLGDAWADIASGAGLTPSQLAERVARALGVGTADLSHPSRAALRLVPEALMRRESILPVRENSAMITVATADPTSLRIELELLRLTGRTPVLAVSPPSAIRQALVALLDSSDAEKAPPRRAVVEGDGTPGKVLVVDDDTSSRLLARTVLEKRGYHVVEASDGLGAVERLKVDQPVALVVADLNMPNMDGLELIWEMRAAPEWAHIPVIVLTGETDEVLETRLIEEGADDYVCKPLDPRLFLARVGATIRRAED